MHDPEFEKQVQQRLGELRINPSGGVWEKVEQEIKKEKRRRPLLWIFLLGGLLVGAGYWWMGAHKIQTIPQAKIMDDDKRSKMADSIMSLSKPKDNSGGLKKGLKKNKPVTNSTVENRSARDNKSIEKNSLIIKPNTSSPQKKSLVAERSVPFLNYKSEKAINKSRIEKEKENRLVTGNKAAENDENDIAMHKPPEIIKNSGTPGNAQIGETPPTNKIEKDKKDSSVKENLSIYPENNKTADVKNAGIKKSRAFHAGLVGGFGVSYLKTMLPAHNSVNSLVGPSGSNSSASSLSIEKGISFYGGVIFEKSFSKRVSFSAGLDYHYYSTRIRTGKTVDSVIFVPSYNVSTSPLIPGLGPQTAYYTSGTINTYTNQYHFLELPVLVNLQVINSKKFQLTGQAGLSLSYLFNVNALQYDPSSGAYYKDNALYNKTQLNLLTGIAAGFHVKKTLIEIGPEFQYEAKNLLRNYTSISEHFIYGGLKLSLMR